MWLRLSWRRSWREPARSGRHHQSGRSSRRRQRPSPRLRRPRRSRSRRPSRYSSRPRHRRRPPRRTRRPPRPRRPHPSPPRRPPRHVPGLAPLPAGATELVERRTESSRTYRDEAGRTTTELYTEPIFYHPAEGAAWQPVEVGFRASADPAVSAISDRAPTSVAVSPSTADGGFLVLRRDGQRIAFHLPDAAARDARAVEPAVAGTVADYRELLPGIDLRVIAGARGAKSFFVWRERPAYPTVSYVVDAPGLALKATKDGAIDLVDLSGTAVARIRAPYAVDSAVDPYTGSGRFTDRVSLALATDGRTVTVSVDEGWLATAVYPVYVDPSTGGSTTRAELPTATPTSRRPTRPPSSPTTSAPTPPYYHELWNGTDPSGTSGASHDYLRWDVSAVTGTTIDAASLALYPYHQYYDAPATTPTWPRRVSESPPNAQPARDRPTVEQPLLLRPRRRTPREGRLERSTCTFNVLDADDHPRLGLEHPPPTSASSSTRTGCGSGSTPARTPTGSGSSPPSTPEPLHIPRDRHLARPERDRDREARLHDDRTFSWTYAGSPAQTKFQVELTSDGGPPAGRPGPRPGRGRRGSWTAPDA